MSALKKSGGLKNSVVFALHKTNRQFLSGHLCIESAKINTEFNGFTTMAWVSGKQLQGGKYTIEKELGEGGFGITYRAKDNYGRYVVIKTLNEQVQRRPDFAKFQQDFINEAIKLAKCSHPHIVQIYEVINDDSLWCIVMEYIDGENLASRVETQGVLSEAEALRYIQQIGQALIVVHNNGLLHRDIKPHNIMLRAGKSEAVLIDFGIAREFSQNLTQTHTQMLADGFAPIEQYDKRAKRGAYTDVYALATTLYSLLTGEVPTIAPIRAIGTSLEEPKNINSNISNRINQAILKGMAVKPENRPQSIEEWIDCLKESPKVPQPISAKTSESAINILKKVPGITKAHRRDFNKATPIFTLKDGTVVKIYKNPVGVDHIFLESKQGKMIFGGFVGWIHSQGLKKAINQIKKKFKESV